MDTEGELFYTEKHDFDIDLVLTALKRCPVDDRDVDIRQYLVAYNELCRYWLWTEVNFTNRRTDAIWAVCGQFCFIAELNELITYTYKYPNP